MKTPAITKKTVAITKEYDKLCFLETLLKNHTHLESYISQFIESKMNHDDLLTKKYFDLIQNNIDDKILFYKIIQLSVSIANETDIQINVDENEQTKYFIAHLEQPFIPFFDNI